MKRKFYLRNLIIIPLMGLTCIQVTGQDNRKIREVRPASGRSVLSDSNRLFSLLQGPVYRAWELGLHVGQMQVSGDVSAAIAPPSFGFHVSRTVSRYFSLQLAYQYGTARGLSYNVAENFAKNPAWGRNLQNPATRYSAPMISTAANGSRVLVSSATGSAGTAWEPVYYNFQTQIHDLSILGQFRLTDLFSRKPNPFYAIYLFAGAGESAYNTDVNALDKGGYKYDFRQISSGGYPDRNATRRALRKLLDNSYETPAENQGIRRAHIFGHAYTLRPSGSVGASLSFRLKDNLSLSIEDRWTIIKDDLLDGQRWQEHAWGDAVLSRDYDSYNSLNIGLRLGMGKQIERKDGVSSVVKDLIRELKAIKDKAKTDSLLLVNNNSGPNARLADTDGDGVADFFDREPNTPTGCPVNSHGVILDTDGDGVPDCRDRELITPTICQPVDKYGVGKCASGMNGGKDLLPLPGNSSRITDATRFMTAGSKDTLQVDIYFNFDKSDLSLAFTDVEKVKEIMVNDDSVKCILSGHTDLEGNDAYNIRLSKDRVEIVKSYLTSYLLAPGRITTLFYGMHRPVILDRDKRMSWRNRRVEVLLYR